MPVPKDKEAGAAEQRDAGSARGSRRLIALGDKSADLSAAVDEAVADYQRLLNRDLSREERELLAKLSKKLARNAREFVL